MSLEDKIDNRKMHAVYGNIFATFTDTNTFIKFVANISSEPFSGVDYFSFSSNIWMGILDGLH